MYGNIIFNVCKFKILFYAKKFKKLQQKSFFNKFMVINMILITIEVFFNLFHFYLFTI